MKEEIDKWFRDWMAFGTGTITEFDFTLESTDPEMNKIPEVREWYRECKKKLEEEMNSTSIGKCQHCTQLYCMECTDAVEYAQFCSRGCEKDNKLEEEMNKKNAKTVKGTRRDR